MAAPAPAPMSGQSATAPGWAARLAQRTGLGARALWRAMAALPLPVWLMPLALIATGYAVPILSKLFVDEVMIAGRSDLVASVIAGLVLAAALRGGVTWWLRRSLLKTQIERAWLHSQEVVDAVLAPGRPPPPGIGPGETASILRGQDQAARAVYGDVVHSVIELPAVPLLFVAMAWFDPLIAALALGLTALNAGGYVLVARRRARMAAQLTVHRGRFAERLTRYLSVIPAIKAGGVEPAVLADWTKAHNRRSRALLALGRISERLGVLPGLVSGLSLAGILGVGAWLILQDRMTPGDLVACQSLFFAISDPVRRFIEASGRLQDVSAEVERRHALTGREGAPTSAPAPDVSLAEQPAPASGPALRLEGLHLLLDGVPRPLPDLVLQAGQHLAITGPSGSGKTRLTRVLAGLEAPAAGQVSIAGQPLAGLDRQRLAARVTLVRRELSGLSGRLSDILTLWDDNADAERLQRALHLSAADEFVGRLPRGLDTYVGPGTADPASGAAGTGIDFSGGQWQRLAIARALVPGPALLVLDEALEALDLGLALVVMERLAAAGVSAALIAHRGETVGRCAELIDLGSGSHEREAAR